MKQRNRGKYHSVIIKINNHWGSSVAIDPKIGALAHEGATRVEGILKMKSQVKAKTNHLRRLSGNYSARPGRPQGRWRFNCPKRKPTLPTYCSHKSEKHETQRSAYSFALSPSLCLSAVFILPWSSSSTCLRACTNGR